MFRRGFPSIIRSLVLYGQQLVYVVQVMQQQQARIIHQKLAEGAELIEDKIPYYKHTPANVLENKYFKLYWNRSVLTDKIIPFNRPDITFMNNKTKDAFMIDITVPYTHNLA